MKSRYIFIILFLLALASGAYFFKDEIFGPEEPTAWDFVPDNAVFVWEWNSTIETWNRLLKTNHWSNLSAIPSINQINKDLIRLDSLTGSSGLLDRILETQQFLISTHTIASNRFDHLFYLELSNQEFRDVALKITDSLQQRNNIEYEERSYHDQMIIEINNKIQKRSFSYFVRDNYFIGSFTPFLVEDAIRTYRKETPKFREQNSAAFQLPGLDFDAGNLYMNLNDLSNFAGLFFVNPKEELISFISDLYGSGFMDIEFDDEYIFTNGFLLTENPSTYLNVFKEQQPVPTDFLNLVPGNTAMLFYQCFTNKNDWYRNVQTYLQENEPGFTDRNDSLPEIFDFDIDRMLTWMESQLIHIDLEAVDENPGKLILVESNDVYEALNQFNRITEKVNEMADDTLYREDYADVTIRLLNLNEFPSRIFGEWYSGFPVTYYTLIDQFMVLSNDIQPIKELIDDREAENTWGQSVIRTEFVNNSLDESNLGIMINTSRIWSQLQRRLDPYWQRGWMQYSRNIKQIEMVSLQVSRTSDKYYSSFVLKNRSGISRKPIESVAKRVLAKGVDYPIIKKPKVTRNHINGSWEILIQDSLDRIRLVDENGETLWQKFLDSPVKGTIHQIDYYNNRKLQYLIATDSLLHIIDRNGEYIENYPVDISDIAVEELAVVDYDNSKNYRFMLAEGNGDIYLLDKEGNRLDGWSPKSFTGKFIIYPFHVRVRGRDVFLGVKENGDVIATNRRGEFIDGFPLDLDTRIAGDIFYQVKSGFDRTFFTVVSEEGQIMEFNLEGKLREKRQLYRPATDTRFWLVNEALGKTYLIARQDLNRLSILDKEGQVLFEKDFFSSDPFHVQYYNFGAGRDLIIVLYAEPGNALIYNDRGTLVTPLLSSEYPVSIVFYESRSFYNIYTASADSLFIHSVQE